MLNKFKKYKSKFDFKKIGILLGALLLSIGLGSGINMTFAGQDIESTLINWFGIKKTQSITDIDAAITAEKDELMIELKVALQEEMQMAKEALEKFTNEEKESRILALNEYADSLKPEMKIDISNQEREVTLNFDAIIEEAIAKMNGLSTPTQPPIPQVEPESDQSPDPGEGKSPESTPAPGAEANPTLDTEAGSNLEPKPDPGTETNPTVKPEPATNSEPIPEPNSN